MFAYSDPTGTGRLDVEGGALLGYRTALHAQYVRFARLANSGFTLLDAFDGLSAGDGVRVDSVGWKAFPLTSNKDDHGIDRDRLSEQDEYVEWQVAHTDASTKRVVFTTEFPEYFEALAAVGVDALVRGIRDVYPNADPTTQELFGNSVDLNTLSSDARAAAFRFQLPKNPWNNGRKGILCLMQRFNTLGALFNLVGHCAVPNSLIEPMAMCEEVSATGACGPGRASDPAVCTASQGLARQPRALSLSDPAGVRITSLGGIWKIDGRAIDINDASHNQGAWKVSRNGTRAVLDGSTGVTLGDSPIQSGAQVARMLNVATLVVSAPDAVVPPWAKLGQESSRAIV